MSLDWQVLQTMIDASPDGIVVCDASDHHWSVVYANRAFEQLCGYSASELRGRNLSFLQQGEKFHNEVWLWRAGPIFLGMSE